MDLLIPYALTVLIILALLAGWIGVQHIARRFADRHPEFGPAREEGSGCGGIFCLCRHGEECPKDRIRKALQHKARQ